MIIVGNPAKQRLRTARSTVHKPAKTSIEPIKPARPMFAKQRLKKR